MRLFTLYVNAGHEIALGAVFVRHAVGRVEDGRTLDAGLFFHFDDRAGAEAAAARARTVPGIDCTIKEYDDGHRVGGG